MSAATAYLAGATAADRSSPQVRAQGWARAGDEATQLHEQATALQQRSQGLAYVDALKQCVSAAQLHPATPAAAAPAATASAPAVSSGGLDYQLRVQAVQAANPGMSYVDAARHLGSGRTAEASNAASALPAGAAAGVGAADAATAYRQAWWDLQGRACRLVSLVGQWPASDIAAALEDIKTAHAALQQSAQAAAMVHAKPVRTARLYVEQHIHSVESRLGSQKR